MRCFAHITNLTVQDGEVNCIAQLRVFVGLVNIQDLLHLILKCRSCLALAKIDSKGLLPLECKTRWNSTYLILEAALKLRTTFERLEEEDT